MSMRAGLDCVHVCMPQVARRGGGEGGGEGRGGMQTKQHLAILGVVLQAILEWSQPVRGRFVAVGLRTPRGFQARRNKPARVIAPPHGGDCARLAYDYTQHDPSGREIRARRGKGGGIGADDEPSRRSCPGRGRLGHPRCLSSLVLLCPFQVSCGPSSGCSPLLSASRPSPQPPVRGLLSFSRAF